MVTLILLLLSILHIAFLQQLDLPELILLTFATALFFPLLVLSSSPVVMVAAAEAAATHSFSLSSSSFCPCLSR